MPARCGVRAAAVCSPLPPRASPRARCGLCPAAPAARAALRPRLLRCGARRGRPSAALRSLRPIGAAAAPVGPGPARPRGPPLRRGRARPVGGLGSPPACGPRCGPLARPPLPAGPLAWVGALGPLRAAPWAVAPPRHPPAGPLRAAPLRAGPPGLLRPRGRWAPAGPLGRARPRGLGRG